MVPENGGCRVTVEKHTTVVSFLLDETRSMQAIKDDTVGGFNAYLDTLQADGADIVFNLVSFNSHETRPRSVAEPLNQIKPLTADTYRPRGTTPLIDAAVTIINATDDALKKRDDTPNVVIVLQTDGLENASVEYTRADLAALITAKEAANWQFVFLGAGLDAFTAAHDAGIRLTADRVISYDRAQSKEAFAETAANVRDFARSGRGQQLRYRDDQRVRVGDRYTGRHRNPTTGAPQPPSSRQRTSSVDDLDLSGT